MDAMMERILEIDRRARNIVDNAEQKNAHIDEIIVAEKEALKHQITEEYSQKLESAKKQISAKARENAVLYADKAAAKMAQLEVCAAENTDQWVDALYKRITEDDTYGSSRCHV